MVFGGVFLVDPTFRASRPRPFLVGAVGGVVCDGSVPLVVVLSSWPFVVAIGLFSIVFVIGCDRLCCGVSWLLVVLSLRDTVGLFRVTVSLCGASVFDSGHTCARWVVVCTHGFDFLSNFFFSFFMEVVVSSSSLDSIHR